MANKQIETALTVSGKDWLDAEKVRAAWGEYIDGASDNSFYIWQWINLGLMQSQKAHANVRASNVDGKVCVFA